LTRTWCRKCARCQAPGLRKYGRTLRLCPGIPSRAPRPHVKGCPARDEPHTLLWGLHLFANKARNFLFPQIGPGHGDHHSSSQQARSINTPSKLETAEPRRTNEVDRAAIPIHLFIWGLLAKP
jgi:hypothetical protein